MNIECRDREATLKWIWLGIWRTEMRMSPKKGVIEARHGAKRMLGTWPPEASRPAKPKSKPRRWTSSSNASTRAWPRRAGAGTAGTAGTALHLVVITDRLGEFGKASSWFSWAQLLVMSYKLYIYMGMSENGVYPQLQQFSRDNDH